MHIGDRQHTAGAVTRYEVQYQDWLDEGRTLTSGAATLLPSAVVDVTVNQNLVTADKLFFFVQGGTVNETFTVQVEVTDTLGETVIDTIAFNVVQP